MKLTKLFIVAAAIVGMFGFTSCTSYERGLVAGAVVGGVVGNVAAKENYNNQYYNNGSYYYKAGYKDGCRGYRANQYNYRNYYDYRNGYSAGRRYCR